MRGRGAQEGCAIALPRGVRGGVPQPCRGGAPEGVCRRGASWKLPHALGGLLCGWRGAPEGCAIALQRGLAGSWWSRGVGRGVLAISSGCKYVAWNWAWGPLFAVVLWLWWGGCGLASRQR